MSYAMRLKAKTHKGKNRIAQWGDEWIILEETDVKFLVFSARDTKPERELPKSVRWIEKVNDPDFQIVG